MLVLQERQEQSPTNVASNGALQTLSRRNACRLTPPERAEAQCGHSGETPISSIFRTSKPDCDLRKKTFGDLIGGTEEI
jgi:hypothetical protein